MSLQQRVSRNRIAQSIEVNRGGSYRRQQPFVPLKDLLQRNHDDRVKEYLDKMRGLTIDEIVNTSNLNSKAVSSRDDMLRQSRATPIKTNDNRYIQVESAYSRNSGSPNTRNLANASSFSMGITPKQVSIVENTIAKAAAISKRNTKMSK